MGEPGLISCERCIRIENNNLGWYFENSVDPVIEGMIVAETMKNNETVNKIMTINCFL